MVDRYSRQLILQNIGEEGQEKLLKSHAVIVGSVFRVLAAIIELAWVLVKYL